MSEYSTINKANVNDMQLRIHDEFNDEVNNIKKLIDEYNQNIDNLSENLDSLMTTLEETGKETFDWYLENREKLHDLKMQLSYLNNCVNESTLKSEIFDLKTNVNMFKFLSMIEAIIIAGMAFGILF